jgi:hypothetical protein
VRRAGPAGGCRSTERSTPPRLNDPGGPPTLFGRVSVHDGLPANAALTHPAPCRPSALQRKLGFKARTDSRGTFAGPPRRCSFAVGPHRPGWVSHLPGRRGRAFASAKGTMRG